MRKTIVLFIAIALLGCSTFPVMAAITEATPRAEYTTAGGDTYQCADTGDASQGWPIWVKEDLRVWLDGVPQVVDTDYTVTFTAGDDSDCSITFVSTPTSGLSVVLERASDQERASDFATSGPFSMASMNSQLDYLTTLAQDNKARIDRAARLDPGAPIGDTFSRLPAPTANYVLGYDASGAYTNLAYTTGSGWDGLTDLADNSSGKGSDLVAHTGTSNTVTETLDLALLRTGDTMTGNLSISKSAPLLTITGDINPALELKSSSGGTPFVDFSNDDVIDFDVRFILIGDDVLNVDGTSSTGFTRDSNTIWDAGNDGTGSGLDADTVDGLEASAFQLATGSEYALVTSLEVIPNDVQTTVTWATEKADTEGFWSAGSPTVFTIPSGVTLVEVYAQISWDINSTGYRLLRLNGPAGAADYRCFDSREASSDPVYGTIQGCSTGPIPVTTADTFSVSVRQNSGGNLTLGGFTPTFVPSFFGIRVIR